MISNGICTRCGDAVSVARDRAGKMYALVPGHRSRSVRVFAAPTRHLRAGVMVLDEQGYVAFTLVPTWRYDGSRPTVVHEHVCAGHFS